MIGVTGAPGTGKSTLVDRLAAYYRGQGNRVGIIAVDPTSPYTGGAILGDRIRMQGHASDPGIFIRSMATRGFLGGLARTTGDVALVLDAAGKQYVLVETVGVGQDEVDIVRLADCTLVLLVPGMGDDVQNMKAGLMEIADIFVLNKSDRDGVERLEAELEAMLQLAPERDGWKPTIIRTVATENKGVDELASAIAKYRERFGNSAARQERKIEHWKSRLLALAGEAVLKRAVSGADGEASARQIGSRSGQPRKGSLRSRSRIARARGRRPEKRMKLGDLEFWLLTDGTFRLDGGAMFGVIPKPMWEKVAPPDARNRILMAMNSLLIRAAGKWILVETGAGDKWDAKRTEIYSFDGPPRLPDKLVTHGVPPEKIDIVINTHLHFDHCGWNTRVVNGEAVPVFPNARYIVQRGELEHAKSPTDRDRASYFPKTLCPWRNRGNGGCWTGDARNRSGRGIDSRAGPQRRHDVRALDRRRENRFLHRGLDSHGGSCPISLDHGVRFVPAHDAGEQEEMDSAGGARRVARHFRARGEDSGGLFARTPGQIRT